MKKMFLGGIVFLLGAVIVAIFFQAENIYDFRRLLPAEGVLLTVTVVAPGGVEPDTGPGPGGGAPHPGGGGGPTSTPAATTTNPGCLLSRVDLNGDCKVDLADFSILAFWYKRPLTVEAQGRVDLSRDGKVDLVDFSILAYYWNRRL